MIEDSLDLWVDEVVMSGGGVRWRCSEITNYTPQPCQCLVGEKDGDDKTGGG